MEEEHKVEANEENEFIEKNENYQNEKSRKLILNKFINYLWIVGGLVTFIYLFFPFLSIDLKSRGSNVVKTYSYSRWQVLFSFPFNNYYVPTGFIFALFLLGILSCFVVCVISLRKESLKIFNIFRKIGIIISSISIVLLFTFLFSICNFYFSYICFSIGLNIIDNFWYPTFFSKKEG